MTEGQALRAEGDGLCHEARDKPAVVSDHQGVIAVVQASARELVDSIESDAFASPGSPFGLHIVVVLLLIMGFSLTRRANVRA